MLDPKEVYDKLDEILDDLNTIDEGSLKLTRNIANLQRSLEDTLGEIDDEIRGRKKKGK